MKGNISNRKATPVKQFISTHNPFVPIVTGLILGVLLIGTLSLSSNEYTRAPALSVAPVPIAPSAPTLNLFPQQGKGDEGPGGESGKEGEESGLSLNPAQPQQSPSLNPVQPQGKGDEGPGGELGAEGGESGLLGTLFNWLNVGLIVGSVVTGPLLLFRKTRQLLTRRAHRVAGITLIALFVLDVILVTGPVGLMSVVELANLIMLGTLASTAAFFYFKPAALFKAQYWPLRNLHVTMAVMYAVKFFAEPLLGGKLG